MVVRGELAPGITTTLLSPRVRFGAPGGAAASASGWRVTVTGAGSSAEAAETAMPAPKPEAMRTETGDGDEETLHASERRDARRRRR